MCKGGGEASLKCRGLAITTWTDGDQAEGSHLAWCADGVGGQELHLCSVPAGDTSLTGTEPRGNGQVQNGGHSTDTWRGLF